MRRVLVVLPNWFGETLFATPFLRHLRRAAPGAFIATLGWPQCREVLAHHPSVNAHVDYDERGAHAGWLAKARLVRELRRMALETAFVLRRSLSRTLLLAWAGIPVRIGFDNAKSGWALTRRVPAAQHPTHKAHAYLPLLEALGHAAPPEPYDYVVGEEERSRARELLRAGADGGEARRLVVLHPGANWDHKRWPPERFAALGERLSRSHQVRIAITGAPEDTGLAQAVAGALQRPVLALAGRTSLRELGACLEQSHLVVSNDTGVLHLAAALRRPVLALYGPTSPALTGPLGAPERIIVLHHPDCCPRVPCYQPEHPGYPGMASISVDEAYEAACRLLGCP